MRNGILSYSNPLIAVASGILFVLFHKVKIKEEHRKAVGNILAYTRFVLCSYMLYSVLHITPMTFDK